MHTFDSGGTVLILARMSVDEWLDRLPLSRQQLLPAALFASGTCNLILFVLCCSGFGTSPQLGQSTSASRNVSDQSPNAAVADDPQSELSPAGRTVFEGGIAEWQDAPFDACYSACRAIVRERLPVADERKVGLEAARLYSGVQAFYRKGSERDEFTRLSFKQLAGATADGFLGIRP